MCVQAEVKFDVNIFGGEVQTEIHCVQCHNSSVTSESFNTLNLGFTDQFAPITDLCILKVCSGGEEGRGFVSCVLQGDASSVCVELR